MSPSTGTIREPDPGKCSELLAGQHGLSFQPVLPTDDTQPRVTVKYWCEIGPYQP